MKRLSFLLAALALACAPGCAITNGGVWARATLARSQSASDLDTYRVSRVAVVPFTGSDLSPERARELENALALELAGRVPFEVVQLSSADLAEIPRAEPYRRGRYSSRTLLGIAERFHVDAILVGTVRELCVYTPQHIATQVELVSCETGQVAWSSSVELDARDARVVEAIEAWCVLERGGDDSPGDEALALLSPAVFTRFAARELARSYP